MEIRDGYIYVLLNFSMSGLVKIGRTTRNPEDRVQELSQATGVPTPFILVYMEHFNDCYAAENQIHLALDSYRISAGREFFEIPPYKAIKLIQTLKESEGEFNEGNSESKITNIRNFSELGEGIYNQAEEYYYGLGDMIQDYDEAFNLYEKAAKLGYAKAYRRLGEMVENGEGKNPNLKKALEYYKEAIKNGDIKGNAYLALLFSKTSSEYYSSENASKCWDKYFRYIGDYEIEIEDEYIIYNYLKNCILQGIEINYLGTLRSYQDKILNYINGFIEQARENYPSMKIQLEKIKKVVLNNFILEEDLVNDFHARVRDVFGYQGNAVLFVEIISGMITVGSKIEVRLGQKRKSATVEYIDKNGNFVHHGRATDKEVSLVLLGEPRTNYENFKGAFVELNIE